VNRLAERALKEFGRVDMLINNATMAKTGSILELPLEEWDQSWAVDVQAAVLGIKAFLPGMLKRKDGTIVTITSGEGIPYLAPYSASKAALRSLGLSLAAELGDESGVSVFVFAPGLVDTPGIREAAREMAPHYGMTYEAFISQRVNPGYDGPMPAEDCAAGFAYVIVHAKDYHGQIADPIQPLNKFDLLPSRQAIVPEPAQKTFIKKPETTEAQSEMAAIYSRAVKLAVELKETLNIVNKEFEEQSYFARMWAKRIFQQRSGLSIKDWVQSSTDLVTQLQNLYRALEAGREEEAKQIKAKLPSNKYIRKTGRLFSKRKRGCEKFYQGPKGSVRSHRGVSLSRKNCACSNFYTGKNSKIAITTKRIAGNSF